MAEETAEQTAADKVLEELVALRAGEPKAAIPALNRLYSEVAGQTHPIKLGFPNPNMARPQTALCIMRLLEEFQREPASQVVEARWAELIEAAQRWSDTAE